MNRALGQRFERSPQHARSDRVEHATEAEEAVFAGQQLQPPRLDALELLESQPVGVVGVAGALAGVAEPAHALFGRPRQEPTLVEVLARRGLLDRLGHTGNEGDVSEPDAALGQRQVGSG